MAWSNPASQSTGDLITASIWNQNVVANPIALRSGAIAIASQAVLDFLYASSATQFARLAKGAAYQVVRLNSTAASYEFADGSVRYGTWTPVIGGSGGTSGQTYAAQTASYVRIGKLVIARFHVALSAKGIITGNVQIQGLPFTLEVGGSGITLLGWHSLATNWVSISADALTGATAWTVTGAAAAAVSNQTTMLVTADLNNASTLSGRFIYETAAA